MQRAQLVKTLELLKPALATNDQVPIFQCFCFSGGFITANNDQIAIIGPTEYEGDCGLHGHTLLGLLSNSKAEELDIALKGDTATIKLGNTISKLPFMPATDFIFEEPKGKWNNELYLTESFILALELALETVSTDETQQALQGISITPNAIFSCNGDTITRIKFDKKQCKENIFLPTSFGSNVIRLWKNLEMTKGVLLFNDEWAYANFEDWSIYGRLLKIDNPIDFEALIKQTVKNDIPLQRVPDGLEGALSRGRVLSDKESAGTRIDISSRLVLATETHMGRVDDTLVFKGHPPIKTTISAAHISKALATCDHIAFHENCTVLSKDNILMVVSNLG